VGWMGEDAGDAGALVGMGLVGLPGGSREEVGVGGGVTVFGPAPMRMARPDGGIVLVECCFLR